ncbi:hypothetical protein DFJ74DRAFT_762915 [Hyaloraphidium curvatum]|nr:hypothetical protein DFJ74DRAFT_762915 [Hyaloraphidium curvatum]
MTRGKPASKLKQSTLDAFTAKRGGRGGRGAGAASVPKATGPARVVVIDSDSDGEGADGGRRVFVEDSQVIVPGTQHLAGRSLAPRQALPGEDDSIAETQMIPTVKPMAHRRPRDEAPEDVEDASGLPRADLAKAIFPEDSRTAEPAQPRRATAAVACPICGASFPQNEIELHASSCTPGGPRPVTGFSKMFARDVVYRIAGEAIDPTPPSAEERPTKRRRKAEAEQDEGPDLVVVSTSLLSPRRPKRKSAPGPTVIHVLEDDDGDEAPARRRKTTGNTEAAPAGGRKDPKGKRKAAPADLEVPFARAEAEGHDDGMEALHGPGAQDNEGFGGDEDGFDEEFDYGGDAGFDPNGHVDDGQPYGDDPTFGFDDWDPGAEPGSPARSPSLSPLQGFVDLRQLRERGEAGRYLEQFDDDAQGPPAAPAAPFDGGGGSQRRGARAGSRSASGSGSGSSGGGGGGSASQRGGWRGRGGGRGYRRPFRGSQRGRGGWRGGSQRGRGRGSRSGSQGIRGMPHREGSARAAKAPDGSEYPNQPYMPPIAAVRRPKPRLQMPTAASEDTLEAMRKIAGRAGDAAAADVYRDPDIEFAEGFLQTTEWESGRFSTRL